MNLFFNENNNLNKNIIIFDSGYSMHYVNLINVKYSL